MWGSLQHGSISCFLLEDLFPAAAADPGRDAQQQEQSQERVPVTVLMGFNQLHLGERNFLVRVVFQNVESLIGIVHMFDHDVRGGDLNSSPAADVLGRRLTPVHQRAVLSVSSKNQRGILAVDALQ